VINTLDIIWQTYRNIYTKSEVCNICNIYNSQYRKLRDEYFRLNISSNVYTKSELWDLWDKKKIDKCDLPQEMINEIDIMFKEYADNIVKVNMVDISKEIEKDKKKITYNRNGIKKDEGGLNKSRNKSKINSNGSKGYELLYPTHHVYDRLKDRFNISDENEANNLINEALNWGFIAKQYKGNRYLIYGKYKFVIYNSRLITVYDRFETKNV
jgi:hypothetical protein